MRGALRTLLTASLLAGCGSGGWSGAGPDCTALRAPVALPEDIKEASGVAVSVAHPGTYWVVNDSDDGTLHAVGEDGASRGRVRVAGAEPRDWEDLALAPCAAGHCLYIANVGDNYLRWDSVFVYRVPEPDPSADSVVAEGFPLRFPDGPRNVEAMFILPGERLHLVTKGSENAVTLYRYPGRLRSDTTVTVVELQRLSSEPKLLPRQVTGGAVTLDGELVALRTYETLGIYVMEGDTLRLLDGGTVNLRTLREGQGEGVGFGPAGRVALVSEAGPMGDRGSLVVLQCGLEGARR